MRFTSELSLLLAVGLVLLIAIMDIVICPMFDAIIKMMDQKKDKNNNDAEHKS